MTELRVKQKDGLTTFTMPACSLVTGALKDYVADLFLPQAGSLFPDVVQALLKSFKNSEVWYLSSTCTEHGTCTERGTYLTAH